MQEKKSTCFCFASGNQDPMRPTNRPFRSLFVHFLTLVETSPHKKQMLLGSKWLEWSLPLYSSRPFILQLDLGVCLQSLRSRPPVATGVGGQREAFTITLDRICDRNMLTRSTFGLDSHRTSIHKTPSIIWKVPTLVYIYTYI